MSHPDNAFYGIPAKEIARICGVDLSTARRWKRGATCPPPTAMMVLRGDLGCLDPAWSGWVIRGGQLISPESWAATPGEILGLPLLRMQLQNYQREERILNRMDAQPLPAPLPQIIAK